VKFLKKEDVTPFKASADEVIYQYQADSKNMGAHPSRFSSFLQLLQLGTPKIQSEVFS